MEDKYSLSACSTNWHDTDPCSDMHPKLRSLGEAENVDV